MGAAGKLEERMAEYRRQRAYDLAHEIKTPATSIMGFAKMLLKGSLEA